MALPTSTRAEIRRAIGSELGMDFYRFYSNYLTCDSGSTTTKVVDTDLTQNDNAWKDMWFYVSENVSTSTGATVDDNVGAVRLINSFSNKDNALILDRALPQTPTNKDRYEIHNNWNAFEIHNAINRAIRDGLPDFFDIVTDETLVTKEDTLEYDISGLTYRPWIISEVWLERPYDSRTGTATAGAATSITDSSADFSAVDSTYKVSIYDGKGAGQLRTCSSGTSAGVINISAAWTTNPDTTSKYRVWDTAEQRSTWYRLTSARFNNHEYPSTMYLPKRYTNLYGSRIRIIYATDSLELNDDTDTTVVPKEFLIYKTIEFLASSRVGSTRGDREHYAVLEQIYRNKAEMFREKHAFRMDTTLWQETDIGMPSGIQYDGDPMGWVR